MRRQPTKPLVPIQGEHIPYIPPGARWYIAEILQEIRVEGDVRNIVHKNLTLIRADSPQEAYERALSLGRESETSYENPDGKQVHITFRGLSELNVIGDELDHGAEILYEDKVAVSEDQIERWIVPKNQLAAFRDIDPSSGPNYSSKEIMDDVASLIADRHRKSPLV
jgi:uncharacterized protein DUF4288